MSKLRNYCTMSAKHKVKVVKKISDLGLIEYDATFDDSEVD